MHIAGLLVQNIKLLVQMKPKNKRTLLSPYYLLPLSNCFKTVIDKFYLRDRIYRHRLLMRSSLLTLSYQKRCCFLYGQPALIKWSLRCKCLYPERDKDRAVALRIPKALSLRFRRKSFVRCSRRADTA